MAMLQFFVQFCLLLICIHIECVHHFKCVTSTSVACNLHFTVDKQHGVVCVGGENQDQREAFVASINEDSDLSLGPELSAFDTTKVNSQHACNFLKMGEATTKQSVFLGTKVFLHETPLDKILSSAFEHALSLADHGVPTASPAPTTKAQAALFSTAPTVLSPTTSPTPEPTISPTPAPTPIDCKKFSMWRRWKCIAKNKYMKYKYLAKKKFDAILGRKKKKKNLKSFISASVNFCNGLSEFEKWGCISNFFGVDQKELIMLHFQSGSKCSKLLDTARWQCLADSIKSDDLLEKSAEDQLFLQELNIEKLRLFTTHNPKIVSKKCPSAFSIKRLKCLANLAGSKGNDKVGGKDKKIKTVTYRMKKSIGIKSNKNSYGIKANKDFTVAIKYHKPDSLISRNQTTVSLKARKFFKNNQTMGFMNKTAAKFNFMNRTSKRYKFSKVMRKGNWYSGLIPAVN